MEINDRKEIIFERFHEKTRDKTIATVNKTEKKLNPKGKLLRQFYLIQRNGCVLCFATTTTIIRIAMHI